MKWFDRWFYRKARWCWHRAGKEYPELKAEQDCLDEISKQDHNRVIETPILVKDRDDNGVDMSNSIRFNVLNCRGGVVLEVRTYNKKTHDNDVKTYLIPEGEPVAERIGQYVTMEMMQQ